MLNNVGMTWSGYEFLPSIHHKSSYLDFLLDEPAKFIAERMKAFFVILTPWPTHDQIIFKKIIQFFYALFSYGLGIYGLNLFVKKRINKNILLLLIPAFGLIVFHTATFSHIRYQMPIQLFVLQFGILSLMDSLKEIKYYEINYKD